MHQTQDMPFDVIKGLRGRQSVKSCGISCIPVVLMCVVLAIFFQEVFELIKEQHKAVMETFNKLQEPMISLKACVMTSPKVFGAGNLSKAVVHIDDCMVSAQLSNSDNVYRYPAMLGELGLGSRLAAIYKLSKQSYYSRPCTCRKQYLLDGEILQNPYNHSSITEVTVRLK
jgi:hypothetical protein